MADFLDEIIRREGGATATNDPDDAGGRTQYGIAEHANPLAWLDGKVTLEEARDIYWNKYVVAPGFDRVRFIPLQHQLVDFGVNAGPSRATKELQRLLSCKQDGQCGPLTLKAINTFLDPRLLNNQFVDARKRFYAQLAAAKPRNKKFLKGWLKRAQEFYLDPL